MGATEVPRGLLIHEYTVDDNGTITGANFIIPTNMNHNNIERDLKALVPTIVDKSQEEITLNLEMLVRAYDPCISCSAHLLNVEFVPVVSPSASLRTGTVEPPMDEVSGPGAAPFHPLVWSEYFVPRPEGGRDPLLRDLTALLTRPDTISFAAGIPAPELYPLDDFRQAMSYILNTAGQTLLQPCPVEGYYPLRQTIARRMAGRGATLQAENILIVTGSQQGLDLIARAFLKADDEVVVEAPSYLGALQIFSAAGARLLGVPLDEEGMRLDVLENILIRYRPKLIYTLPTFQNPSGCTMAPRRRLRLLELARRHRVPIVEDDPYGELYYTDQAPSPLLALDQDGYVIYLSTFSKILFPGLRLGWVAAPRPVIERLSQIKQLADLHCSTLIQGVVHEFCQRGALDKHLDHVRDLYRQRRDAMLSALAEHGPADLEWDEPQGGFNLWCRLPPGLKARQVMAEAARQSVALVPGEVFYPDGGGQEEMRLNFSCPPVALIEEGVQRLGVAMTTLMRRRKKEKPGREVEVETQPIV